MQLRPFAEKATVFLSLGHASVGVPAVSALPPPAHHQQLFEAHYGTVPTPVWDTAATVQRFGESAFTATFIVALLQAGIALFQYKSNPAGELIEPPGPTIGTELPPSLQNTTNSMVGGALLERRRRASFQSKLKRFRELAKNSTRTSTSTSRYAQILNSINRALFLLIPLASTTARNVIGRQWHLMHVGFILSLARIFDIPASFFEKRQHKRGVDQEVDICTLGSGKVTADKPSSFERVVVIGDSLAIGLGTLDVFDKEKNQSIDYHLTENLAASPDLPGPVFPRVLAAKFAEFQNRQVHWRSAGVDGGTISHIQEFCLDVIRQEVENGRPPDCVVVLCGINDLKMFFSSNPFKPLTLKGFRQNLNHLIVETLKLCPNATVVLPALPVQMFRFNSPLNIFPLALFLDAIVGFWESQKKVVVENFPSDSVRFIGLSREEIEQWYRSKDTFLGLDDHSSSHPPRKKDSGGGAGASGRQLMSADGVHPNAKCYAKWAESVARNIL